MDARERNGIVAALVSSALGGSAGALTRYVIGAIDPVTLAAFRFGIAFLLVLPVALVVRAAWPRGKDWYGVAALGVLFFCIFFVLYNTALAYTSAAHGSLALSTLPVTTMLVGALLGVEALTPRKTTGVLIATAGAAMALATGLADAPAGAWRGDLIMMGATLIMALYSVWSRALIARSSRLGFLVAGMGFGAAASVAVALHAGGFVAAQHFGLAQWSAVTAIAALGGAASFYLWVYALERTTPTRVTNTMTVNPISASVLASVLLGEPLGFNLALGVLAVGAGIWIASTRAR
ncbi:MAG TPA: DMT family transporter [Steroidobacteraceae bacterium]|nr:DMT family transporter [Steroidobacteraceae bacterium]